MPSFLWFIWKTHQNVVLLRASTGKYKMEHIILDIFQMSSARHFVKRLIYNNC